MTASTKNYLYGIFFCTYTFLNAFFGSIFIMGPFLPLMIINMKWFRACMDFAINLWLILPGALFELFYGTKVVITGDQVDSSKSSLIIMNHRCRLDWMFYWMVHMRTGRLANEKIIMRGDLKYMVGFGWCMQNAMYFFLQRRWDLDHNYLERMLNYFIDIKYPLQLFIFPEGTNMCNRGKEKSDIFAEKNGLPKYQYVLHPHVKGFNYLVQKLRGKAIDSIHDVTIGYPKNLCYGEKDLLTGNFPSEIHVHFKSYNIADIPHDSDSLDEWCKNIWREKEERLRKFYVNGEFVGEPVHYNDKSSIFKYNLIMGLVNFFWAIFLFTCIYSIWWYSFIRWYSLLMVIFYVIVSYFGGVDNLQLYFHYRIRNNVFDKKT